MKAKCLPPSISVLALTVVLAGGCVQKADISYCPNGLMCPPGMKCAAMQDVCISDNCGNGKLDVDEVCDDGNIMSGDGCSENCQSKEICGNGIVDEKMDEQCDPPDPEKGCSELCKVLGCGNGFTDPGEECDSGPGLNGQPNLAEETPFCNSDCTWARHGDGKVNKEAGEDCDGDGDGRGNGHDCQSPNCNSDCTMSAHGDGKVNPDAGELCDGDGLGNGNGNGQDCESATCNYNCTPLRCGDGLVNLTAGEQCDRDGAVGHDGMSGPNGQSATCNLDCTASACGDGKVNPLASENCDDGPANSPTGNCLKDCRLNVCGDGFVNTTRDANGHPREECDGDEGEANSDTGGCLTTCKKATCGDGFVHAGSEDCDEGPGSASTMAACPYGQKTCTLCSVCKWVQLTGPYCGDGQHDAKEACDDGPKNGATSCDYGVETCALCNADCSKTVARIGPYCGDHVTNGPEVCDDGNKDNESACPYGVPTCTACDSDCATVLGPLKGAYCGDAVLDRVNKETCDSPVSVACGTCAPPGAAGPFPQCTRIPAAPAAGTLTVVSTDLLGATFTLSDTMATKAFEFVSGSLPSTGNLAVDIDASGGDAGSAQPTRSFIALRIARAIANSGLRVTVDQPPDTSEVIVANSEGAGLFGNIPITFTTLQASQLGALVVAGMSGGIGCRVGDQCSDPGDCAIGRPICEAPFPGLPRTCSE